MRLIMNYTDKQSVFAYLNPFNYQFGTYAQSITYKAQENLSWLSEQAMEVFKATDQAPLWSESNQQGKAFYVYRTWRSTFKQGLKLLIADIIDKHANPETLSNIFISQHEKCLNYIESPFYYDHFLKKQAAFLDKSEKTHILAVRLNKVRDHLKKTLKAQPKLAVEYFYKDIINNLIDLSANTFSPNPISPEFMRKALSYYKEMVPNDIYNAAFVQLTPLLKASEKNYYLAVDSDTKYRRLLDQLTHTLKPYLIESHKENLLPIAKDSFSLGNVISRASEQLSSGFIEFNKLSAKNKAMGALVFSSTLIQLTKAQSFAGGFFNQTFIKTLGDINGDAGLATIACRDGGTLVTGYTGNYGAQSADVLITKYALEGNILWATALRGYGAEAATSVYESIDGGTILTGYTTSFSTGSSNYDIFLSKLSYNGTLEWSHTLGTPGIDIGTVALAAADGGTFVMGNSDSLNINYGALLAKFSGNGTFEWMRYLGINTVYSAYSNNDTSIMLAGTGVPAGGNSNFAAVLMKLSNNGVVQWARQFPGYTNARSICPSQDGGTFFTGYYPVSGSFNDIIVAKFSPEGTEEWERTLGYGFDGTDDIAKIIYATPDNGVLVSGTTRGRGDSTSTDILLLKINSTGGLDWLHTIGKAGTLDDVSGMFLTADNGTFLTGFTDSFGAGNRDILLAKLDANGNIPDCAFFNTLATPTYPQWKSNTLNVTSFTPVLSAPTFVFQNWPVFGITIVPLPIQQSQCPIENIVTTGETNTNTNTGTVSSTSDTTGNDINYPVYLMSIGDINGDSGSGVFATGDGGILLSGNTYNYGAALLDIILTKVDNSGQVQWAGRFGAPGNDYSIGSYENQDESMVVAGYTTSYSAGISGNPDVYLAKVYRNGTVPWSRIFGGVNSDMAYALHPTEDGGTVVVGHTNENRILMLKANGGGGLQWANEITLAGNMPGSYGFATSASMDGGSFIAGRHCDSGACNVLIYKMKGDGTVDWARKLGGRLERGLGICTTSKGGSVVTGITTTSGTTAIDLFVAQFNRAGTLEWERTLEGTKDDQSTAVHANPDGSVVVVGVTNSFGNGDYDVLIAKVNSNGDLLAAHTLGTNATERATATCLSKDGNTVITGYSNSFNVNDILLAKLDPQGNIFGCNILQAINPSWKIVDYPVSNIAPILTPSSFLFRNWNMTGEIVTPNQTQQCYYSPPTSQSSQITTSLTSSQSSTASSSSSSSSAPIISTQSATSTSVATTVASTSSVASESSQLTSSSSFARTSSTQTDAQPDVVASESPLSTLLIAAIAGSVGGSTGLVICFVVFCFVAKKRRNRKNTEEDQSIDLDPLSGLPSPQQSSKNKPVTSHPDDIVMGSHVYRIKLTPQELAHFDKQITLASYEDAEGRHLVGRGTFGMAYKALALHLQSKAVVCKELLNPDQQAIDNAKNEAELQREISELPYIMPLMNWHYRATPTPTLLIFLPAALFSGKDFMNLYANLSLSNPLFPPEDRLFARTNLSPAVRDLAGDTIRLKTEMAIHLVIDLLKSMKSLQDREEVIVHHDIKPDNILFRKNGEANLADLGCARKESGPISEFRLGSTRYKSAEQLLVERREFTEVASYDGKKRDIYAVGITLFEMLLNTFPLYPASNREMATQWGMAQFNEAFTLFRQAPQQTLPPDLFTFIALLINLDPKKRPSPQEALANDIFIPHEHCSYHQLRAKAFKRLQQLKTLAEAPVEEIPNNTYGQTPEGIGSEQGFVTQSDSGSQTPQNTYALSPKLGQAIQPSAEDETKAAYDIPDKSEISDSDLESSQLSLASRKAELKEQAKVKTPERTSRPLSFFAPSANLGEERKVRPSYSEERDKIYFRPQ